MSVVDVVLAPNTLLSSNAYMYILYVYTSVKNEGALINEQFQISFSRSLYIMLTFEMLAQYEGTSATEYTQHCFPQTPAIK